MHRGLTASAACTSRKAENNDRVVPGQVIIGAGGLQLRLAKDARGYYVKSEGSEKVGGFCPAVDVLFNSVAEAAGRNAMGVILTGMGADGSKGLLKMRKAGAYTIRSGSGKLCRLWNAYGRF